MQQAPSGDGSSKNGKSMEKQANALSYAQKLNYTLFDISNALNTTRNLDQLYHSIYQSLNKLMPLPNFYIALYDKNKKTINFDFFIDEFDDGFPIIENLSKPNCLTGEVICAKRPLFLKRNMLIERARKNRLIGTIPKIWLGVPLLIKDSVIGAIAVQHYSDADYFTHHHLEIFVSVSEQIALAIERKQMSETLEKKEKTLNLITDNSSSTVAVVNSLGMFEFANPAYKNLGFDPDDLTGTSFFDLIHPDDATPLLKFLETGITGSATHMTLEFRIKNNNGQFQPVKGSFDLIKNKDGLMEKIIFIGEDILEKKTNRKAMQEVEERFQLIFETSPDAIVITHLETGKIFDINTAFAKLAGMEKERLIGKQIRDIGIWESKARQSDFISVIKKNKSYKNLEAKLVFKSKSIDTLISSKQLSLSGQPYLLSIIKDVSALKTLEGQLVRRQKMDSIGTLTGGIAHDFNNILSSIMGYLELMNFDDDNLSEEQKESISNALISSKRAAKLIRRLQILTKSSDTKPAPVDLFKVADNVFSILEQTTSPMIDKQNDLIENKYFVTGYEDELHQVFMNLGMNAIQAIKQQKDRKTGQPHPHSKHFIRLYISTETLEESVPSLAEDTPFLHLCFEDTGCGMTPDVQKQAFDPMFSTKRTEDRNGLGLAMVYYIITKKHKGAVDINTRPGYGTTFHLYLPITEDKPADGKKEKPNTNRGDKTVLVIDDEDMIRDMAVKTLESFGYNALEAADGKAGVAVYRKNHHFIDAVLLDIIMPKMSGVETFKQLLQINPNVKVIIASGHITNQEQKKLFARATAYLDKPYQIMELKQILHSIIN